MGKNEQILEQELGALQEQVDALETALEQRPDGGRGRGDPSISRHELNRVMLGRLEQRVVDIRQALARLDQGSYGTCATCGIAIHPDRLAVLPDAQLCIGCAQTAERGE